MNRRIFVQLMVLALVCVFVVGCGSKVSKDNYDKVAVGMSVADVEAILGKGTEDASGAGSIGKLSGSGKIMTWTDGEKSITVTFLNDKVSVKAQKGL